MKLTLYLAVILMLTSCGYHLVGQGESAYIPKGVVSANLQSTERADTQPLLAALTQAWEGNTYLPSLQDESFGQESVVLRIEKQNITFNPTGFDASGLAIQYRLNISAVLNMYQEHQLIWQSGTVAVFADVFEGSDSSVIEAERVRLTEQLQHQWAQQALARLQSGF